MCILVVLYLAEKTIVGCYWWNSILYAHLGLKIVLFREQSVQYEI